MNQAACDKRNSITGWRLLSYFQTFGIAPPPFVSTVKAGSEYIVSEHFWFM